MSFLISTSQIAFHASALSWYCEHLTKADPQMPNSQLSLFLLAIFNSEKSASVLQAHLSPYITVSCSGLQPATQLPSSITKDICVQLPLTA